MKCVAIILARGGSKGIKNKNLIEINKKPLIGWTIEHAINCKNLSHVFVSSDSEKILNCAEKFGSKTIKRPSKISSDTSTSELGWLHALNHIEEKLKFSPDIILGPQVTSPIRKHDDFSNAINYFIKNEYDSLLTVNIMKDFFIWEKLKNNYNSVNYDFKNRPRRQLIKEKFHENGSFYLFKPEILKKHKNRLGGKIGIYIMDKLQQYQIDEPDDIKTCEFILRSYNEFN